MGISHRCTVHVVYTIEIIVKNIISFKNSLHTVLDLNIVEVFDDIRKLLMSFSIIQIETQC